MDLEQKAIARIRFASGQSLHYYTRSLICTYSGGKDSDVLLELFHRSGVPYEVRHSHTTVDAPPTVYHVRDVFRQLEVQGIKCAIDMPTYKGKRINMWDLIVKTTLPPTRKMRYCCRVLKESHNNNSYMATGVRWEESMARKGRSEFEKLGSRKKYREDFTLTVLENDNTAKRRMTELCMYKNKMVVNPIIDWTDADVWDYIASEKIRVCGLYKNGYTRVGCIGCPMAGKRWREKEFMDYPAYKKL